MEMDETAIPVDKAMIITSIEYMILNLYNNPDSMFPAICQLIDEHQITGMKDTMTYFYEMLLFRGYEDHAQKFAEKYSIPPLNN